MSKRLPDLLRQRAILQEHLAWLEREIAAEQGSPAAAPAPSPAPVPIVGTSLREVSSETTGMMKQPPAPQSSQAAPTTPPPLPELPADVEKIVAQYRQDPGSLTQDTRRGCLMIFWIALGSMLLTSGIVYWLYARHLGRWW